MTGYRTCIFDFYGTLVDIHTDENAPQVWEALAAHYSARGAVYRPKELRDAYFRAVAEAEGSAPLRRDAHEVHPEIQIEPVFAKLFRDRGVPADGERSAEAGRRFRALSTDYIRLYPGAKELLHTLRAQGRGVYLLSNAQALFTRTELDELGLTDCFDGICLSSDYGVKKPDRRFFEVLFQTCGLSPEGAVMVGNDGICDIQGAREAGLDTVYIRSNLSPDEPAPEADFVLAEMDLGKVLDILTHGRDGTWQAAIR